MHDDVSGPLSSDELARYARHLVLPEIGETGQRRLRDASVLVAGAGGLGSPLAIYLAAAGVGRIGLAEFDTVSLANLQRQILYETADVGRPKLEAAVRHLTALNPQVRVEPVETRLSAANALEVIGHYDVVADGTDNFAARYLINDACALLGRPDVQGSIFRFEGQVAVFDPPRGPCYRCLFREPPPPGAVPPCSESGVLGVLPGIIGTLQANEVIKLLLGVGEPLRGRLLLFDALRGSFREIAVAPDPGCPLCGREPVIRELRDQADACHAPASEAGPQSEEPAAGRIAAPFDLELLEVTPEAVAPLLDRPAAPLLLDVREAIEVRICSLPGMVWIPMGQLPDRTAELPLDRPIVIYCHLGARSWQAARYLRARGMTATWSLAGGIDAWARRIDPSLRRY